MITQANALRIPLKNESVQCVIISQGGRIKPGQHLSPETEFKKGEHWRSHREHWDRKWLYEEYVVKGRSCGDIAEQQKVTDAAILYWLRKHKIKRRDVSESRRLKQWGLSGEQNGMYGRTGERNPNYKDGSSPERQRLYSQSEYIKFLSQIYKRDGYRCVRCGMPKGKPRSLHAHHKKSWAGHPGLRWDKDNVVTLCFPCHGFVHSKKNINREYLEEVVKSDDR